MKVRFRLRKRKSLLLLFAIQKGRDEKIRFSWLKRLPGEKIPNASYLIRLQRNTEQMIPKIYKESRYVTLEKKPTKFRQYPAYIWRFKIMSKGELQVITVLRFIRNGELYASSIAVNGRNLDTKSVATARSAWNKMMSSLRDAEK